MKELPLHPMDPINRARPVDARWHRIIALADCGRGAWHMHDDVSIKRGLRFVKRLRNCEGQSDRKRLSREFPDLDAAYRLHASDDKLGRAIVEARLLARQSVGEVADATGLEVDAVVAYEKIFFQVLGRLDARLFILHHAVGVDSGYGLREEDTGTLLKLFAYQRGPLYLELVLRYIRLGIRVPERFDQASRAELEELVTMLGIRGVILARVLPFAEIHRAMRVMELAQELKTSIAFLSDKGVVHQEGANFAETSSPSKTRPTEMEVKVEPVSPTCQAVSAKWWSAFRETILAA